MKKTMVGTAMVSALLLASCGGHQVRPSLKTEVDTVSYEVGLANTNGIEAYFQQMGIDSAYIDDFLKGVKDAAISGDNKAKDAYFLGLQAGLQIKQQMVPAIEQRLFAGDSTSHISMRNFLAGFTAGVNKKSALKVDGKVITPEMAGMSANERIRRIAEVSMEKVYGPKKKAAESFMANIAKQEGVQALPGGVYYKIVKVGTGALPKATDMVEVEYEGKLPNGQVFDSSIQRQPGKPVPMPVGGVVEGLKIALQQMPVGSEWEVFLPYDKAYGAEGQGPIEPFSPLIFKIKLVKIASATDHQQGVEAPIQ